MSFYDNLTRMGIQLPHAAAPLAAYVPYVQSGKLIFVSGHIAKKDGRPWQGQLGINMTTEEGREAARLVAIDLLGTLQAATGDLNRISRIVSITVLVNSSPEFQEHHLVANGASELLQAVFGDAGRHARAAFGVTQIPLGACVEIVLTAEVEPDRSHP